MTEVCICLHIYKPCTNSNLIMMSIALLGVSSAMVLYSKVFVLYTAKKSLSETVCVRIKTALQTVCAEGNGIGMERKGTPKS